jgi:uncharacterized protein YndB with AHSA1/START domain
MKAIISDLTAVSTVTIDVPVSRVWEALVTPALIKQYLHGTDVESDWKVNHPITFRGVWKGKSYEDKGVIKQVEPEHMLQYSFWSSLAGKPDKPENYILVTYKLESKGEAETLLTIMADDPNADEKVREHMEQNWSMVLKALKDLLEETY